MERYEVNETKLKELIIQTIVEYVGQKAYGDMMPTRTSVKTGGYGGANVHKGARGGSDYYRGDKDKYYAGIPTPESVEKVSTAKMEFFKAKNFGANKDKIESSANLFNSVGEMGWEMNNLQSATRGAVRWKVVTDDPNARISNGKVIGKRIFWFVLLPGADKWQLFKPNLDKRYIDDYNPTVIKRINR